MKVTRITPDLTREEIRKRLHDWEVNAMIWGKAKLEIVKDDTEG